MKKIVTALGYTFLTLIAATVISVGVLYFEGKKLDKESKAFADSAITAITADWSVDELKKRASAEFENDVDYDEIQEYLDSLGVLGKFGAFPASTDGVSVLTKWNVSEEPGLM